MTPDPEIPTGLARALDRLSRAPEGAAEAARLALFEALSVSELFVLLRAEAEGGTIAPQVFDTEAGPTVLAFDTEAALADFAGQAVAYAALPGRVLAGMLAEAGGTALLVQAGAGQGELMPPATLAWLAARLTGPAPRAAEGVARGYGPPRLAPGLLAVLVPALERRLSGIPGLEAAVLASVAWAEGGEGHLLALGGVAEAAQAPLARSVAEALEFSGMDGGLDVVFPPAGALAPIAAVGLRLSPAPWVAPEARPAPAAPGMDPSRPPKLR